MAEPDKAPPRYRPAVGIMLQNRQREVFVGRRIDMPSSRRRSAPTRLRYSPKAGLG